MPRLFFRLIIKIKPKSIMLLQRLKELSLMNESNILVVGDLMLDQYIWGDCTRLSPEAPVPIIDVKKETLTLGGAANVAQNLTSYGANVFIAGVCGDDIASSQLFKLFESKKVNTSYIYKHPERVTTQKTRIIAGSHHITRVDREMADPISDNIADQILEKLNDLILSCDIILLSDYNKGLLTPYFTQKIIALSKEHEKKVLVDPKGLDYQKYSGAYLIKPNKKELAEAAKVGKIKTEEELTIAARNILNATNATYLVVTLSEDGIAVFSKSDYKHFAVKATEIFDVTGAGDTVLATLAYFISHEFSIDEACELANHAAAIVVKHVGSAVTTIDQLIVDIEKN